MCIVKNKLRMFIFVTLSCIINCASRGDIRGDSAYHDDSPLFFIPNPDQKLDLIGFGYSGQSTSIMQRQMPPIRQKCVARLAAKLKIIKECWKMKGKKSLPLMWFKNDSVDDERFYNGRYWNFVDLHGSSQFPKGLEPMPSGIQEEIMRITLDLKTQNQKSSLPRESGFMIQAVDIFAQSSPVSR